MLGKLLKILFGKKEERRLTEVEEIQRESRKREAERVRKSKPHLRVSGNTYNLPSTPSQEVDSDYSPRSGITHSSYLDSGPGTDNDPA